MIAGNLPLDSGSALLREAIQNKNTTKWFTINEEIFLSKHHLFSNTNVPSGSIIASNLDEALKPFKSLEKRIIIVGLLVFVIGILFTLFFYNPVVRPLRLLLAGIGEVEKGNFDFRVSFKSKDKVGQIEGSFNNMAQGLKEKNRCEILLINTFIHQSLPIY